MAAIQAAARGQIDAEHVDIGRNLVCRAASGARSPW
jgi:hypothetical protein